MFAHRLVAFAFLKEKSGKPMINHIDGVKTNNHYSNLEWVDRSENQLHAFKNGLQKKVFGENHKGSKLRYHEVKQIKLMASKHTQKNVAKKFGISQSHVSSIVRGEYWNSDK